MPYKARKNWKNFIKKSDTEIINLVREEMGRRGKTISNAQCRFLLRLIDYACKYGSESEDGRGLIIYLSLDEIVDKFNVSKSMVIKCLSIYRYARIIERIKDSIDPRCTNTLVLEKYYKQ